MQYLNETHVSTYCIDISPFKLYLGWIQVDWDTLAIEMTGKKGPPINLNSPLLFEVFLAFHLLYKMNKNSCLFYHLK